MTPTPPEGKEQPGTHDLGPICGPHKGDPLSRQMLEKVIVAVMEEPSCPTCAGMNDLVATQGQRIAELERELTIERGESAEGSKILQEQDEELVQLRATIETLTRERDEARVGLEKEYAYRDSELDKAHQQIADLRAQLAASEKDRERLDWLEKQNTQRELTWGNGSGPSGITTARLSRYLSLGRVQINLDTGEPGADLPIPTLRAAIDAAMKEAK